MIYFIQAEQGGLIKIGKTITLAPRIYQHSRSLGKPVCVLGIRKGELLEEMRIHDLFDRLRVTGEWFRPEDALLRFIAKYTKPWDGTEPDISLSTVARNPRTTKIPIGHRVGRWTVISAPSLRQSSTCQFRVTYQCQCECGSVKTVPAHTLIRAQSRSCGCLKSDVTKGRFTKHGGCGTRLYHLWKHIVGRCYNPKNQSYRLYGGRGVGICAEWNGNFAAFRDWALAAGYTDGLSIEIPDGLRDFGPDNCKFVETKTFAKMVAARARAAKAL